MFSLICVWINGWVNNREAGDLRRYRRHDDVIVMYMQLNLFITRSRFSQILTGDTSLVAHWGVVLWECILRVFILSRSMYRQTSKISRTKSRNKDFSRLVFQLSLPIHWSQVLSREWRCSWSSADRQCCNYIWVIYNFIAYYKVQLISEVWMCAISCYYRLCYKQVLSL